MENEKIDLVMKISVNIILFKKHIQNLNSISNYQSRFVLFD